MSEGTTHSAGSTPGLLSIEEFSRIDLRVATIVEAEHVAGTTRLMRLQVDLGAEKRQLVAGIAEAYTPESLLGKSIIVVANLKPARLRGLESNGMLLAATPEGRMPILATFDREVPPGTTVK